MLLTPRDSEILSTLTWKARLLNIEQLATTWWNAGRSGRIEARRRADRLIAAGLLRKLVVLSRPLPPLEKPVIVCEMFGPTVNFRRVAQLLQKRWSAPPCSTSVYIATAKAAAFTGGKAPGLKHPLQASHDLAVMQVYLQNAKGASVSG